MGKIINKAEYPNYVWSYKFLEGRTERGGKLRDELLSREIFTTLEEASVLIEQWRREYNQVRLYSALGYKPPAPETILTMATM